MLNIFKLKIPLLFAVILMANSLSFAQVKPGEPQFIGPIDYQLPPPMSDEEKLRLELAERIETPIEVPQLLFKSYLLPHLKKTGNTQYTSLKEVGDNQSLEGWLLLEIERAMQYNELNYAADLHNLLACEYFRLGNVENSFNFFERALLLKTELKAMDDISLIQFNIGKAYEFMEDYPCALNTFSNVLSHAKRTGNKLEQLYASMHMASIKAKGGSYFEAERDLIHHILPGFKSLRSKRGENGRIEAYIVLSQVYLLQDRYPETQWFLLQAREIVEKEGLNQWMPEIVFNLAQTKKESGNYDIALLEYEMAQEMAEEKDLLVMQLAIQEAMGHIYNEAGQFKEALEALNRYDSLKNQIISMEYPQ